MNSKKRMNQFWVQICHLDYEDGITRATCGTGDYCIGYRFSRQCYDAGLKSSKFFSNVQLLDALKNKGIYFLMYRDSRGEVGKIYVGKSGERAIEKLGVMNRINEHARDKYKNWDEAVVLTLKDNSMNATKVSFLEHEFYCMIKKLRGEKILANENTPTGSSPSDRELSDLQTFVSEHAPRIVSALGYSFLEERKRHVNARSKTQKAADEENKAMADEQTFVADCKWDCHTQLAKAFASKYNEGKGADGISAILVGRRKAGKWRNLLEQVGVKFDANDRVSDWQRAKNPL